MKFTAAFIVTLTFLSGGQSGINNAGPYDLKFLRLEECEDQGTAQVAGNIHLTQKSGDETTAMHGSTSLPFDYDDKVQAQLNFSKLGSRGGWGNNPYTLKLQNYCQQFKNDYPALFEFYHRGWGIENPSCPIKAGNYTVDLDTTLPQLPSRPQLPYGTYRVTYALLRGDPPVRFLCYTWYISCTQRPR